METLSLPDLVVFGLLLLLPVLLGVCMSCFTGFRSSFDDLLFGAGNLPTLPSGFALPLPLLAAAALIDAPVAVLRSSSAFFLPLGVVAGFLTGSLCSAEVVVPLRVLSINEFLRLRFRSPAVGLAGACLAGLGAALFVADSLERPARLLASLTDGAVSPWTAVGVTVAVGWLCAALGGIRAVVWASVAQTAICVAAMFALLVTTQQAAGGPRASIAAAAFNPPELSPDPRVSDTLWGAVIGTAVHYLFVGLCPQTAQRMRAVNSIPQARFVFCLAGAGLGLLWAAGSVVGVGLAAISPCNATEPLLDFLSRRLGPPGLSGLVLAGMFTGAVAAVANAVSALVAMAWEDLVRSFDFWSGPRLRATVAASLLSLLFAGLFALFGLLAAASELAFLPTARAVLGAVAGTYAGLLVLALFCPQVTGPAVLTAPLSGLAVILWQSLGGLTHAVSPIPAAALSNDSCPAPAPDWEALRTGLTPFYAIDPVWRPTMALLVTVLVGVIAGRLTSKRGHPPDAQLVLCSCCGRCRLDANVEDGMEDFDYLPHDSICPIHSRSNLRLDDGTVRTEIVHLTGVRPSDSSTDHPTDTLRVEDEHTPLARS